MLESTTFAITGITPTIMHNGQLANPLNRWARAIKEITGKRKKSEEDMEAIARLEFLGSLYLLDGDSGAPCWPGVNIEIMLRDAARLEKRGKDVMRSVWVPDDAPLVYDGPKAPEKLWEIERFRDIRSAVVSGRRIVRCRPVFHDWKLEFAVQFSAEAVNPDDVARWVRIASSSIGLSDFRPRYGRFNVDEMR
jgi:hypothetical protein